MREQYSLSCVFVRQSFALFINFTSANLCITMYQPLQVHIPGFIEVGACLRQHKLNMTMSGVLLLFQG